MLMYLVILALGTVTVSVVLGIVGFRLNWSVTALLFTTDDWGPMNSLG